MRDIKFRGKTINGEWVYGNLVQGNDDTGCCIIDYANHETDTYSWNEVHPDSVGEYTGLKDKNGNEIYEGDIVKWDDNSNGKYWRVAVVEINPDIRFRIVKNTTHELSTKDGYIFEYGNFIYTDTHNHLTIVGNIHQNPELLK